MRRRRLVLLLLVLLVTNNPQPVTAGNPLSWVLRTLSGGQDPSLALREAFVELMIRLGGSPRGLRNVAEDRLQTLRPPDEPFPCRMEESGPSEPPPTSVHRLRPADVRVVAAMGDSLTAGNGALASGVLQVFAENRGVVWSIGGEGNWRQYLTLPNILREFRKGDLIGYSLGDGLSHARQAQFNVADPNAFSWDMPYMSRVLVNRIRSDPRVDFKRDWKLVTLLVGSNDLCNQMCHEEVGQPRIWERHAAGLKEALDYLQSHLPRTLVNLVVTPDVTRVLARRGLSATCRVVNYLECPCLLSPSRALPLEFSEEAVRRVQQAEIDLVASGRYDVTEDFTVVIQPFSSNLSFPKDPSDGKTDLSYLSHDCFHFSQKGYAWAANALWNNMLEPVGHKSQSKFEETFSRFLCPTLKQPFIFTSRNSGSNGDNVTAGAT